MFKKFLAAGAMIAAPATAFADGGHPAMADHALAHALYLGLPLALALTAASVLIAWRKRRRE